MADGTIKKLPPGKSGSSGGGGNGSESGITNEEEQKKINFDEHLGKTFRITEPEGDSKRQGFSIVTPENGDAWSGPKAWKDRPEFHDIAKIILIDQDG